MEPRGPSHVRPGCLLSPLPAPLVLAGGALAGLAPKPCRRLAVGLCSLPGVAEMTALSKSRSAPFMVLSTFPEAQGSLQTPGPATGTQPWQLHEPDVLHRPLSTRPATRSSPAFCLDDFFFSFLLLTYLLLSPEAINCLMRAIEIYTDMVRVAARPVPFLSCPIAPACCPQPQHQEHVRGAVGVRGVWSSGPAPAPGSHPHGR